MTPFHFFHSPLLLAENLFFRDRTCSLSIYPYLISLRAGKGNVEANPDKKPRLFSDSYQIWIQFAIQTTRSASDPFSLSVLRCFDIPVFVPEREIMSTIHARGTLDPVTQWPRTTVYDTLVLVNFLFFITLHVWEMNEYTYDENEENDTSTVADGDGSTRIRCQSNNMTTNCRRFQMGCLTS